MKESLIKINELENNHISKWIHLWGGAASEAILDPSSLFFYVPDIEGFIGYQIESNFAIVFGDPICAIENVPFLTNAFHSFCQEKKLKIIYLAVSERFAKWAIQSICRVLIQVGDEMTFDPYDCKPVEGSKGFRMRNRINHVTRLGLTFHEYFLDDLKIENAIQELGNTWQQARRGPQIYLGNLDFFDYRDDRRWFYVKDKEKILAMATLCRREARKGWLLKHFITLQKAPRGTSEFLMMSILETLHQENCHFLTYGTIPVDHLEEIQGLNQASIWMAKKAYKFLKWFFKLSNRKAYWQKFHPKIEKNYVLLNTPHIGVKEICALMKALKFQL